MSQICCIRKFCHLISKYFLCNCYDIQAQCYSVKNGNRHRLGKDAWMVNSYVTSIAFLIILASNSAGVSMRPMISLSKFFDSSDFRSFIRSWTIRHSEVLESRHGRRRVSKRFHVYFCYYIESRLILTLPSSDLKACLISCLCALLLRATISMIASSSVPVVKKEGMTLALWNHLCGVRVLYWEGLHTEPLHSFPQGLCISSRVKIRRRADCRP